MFWSLVHWMRFPISCMGLLADRTRSRWGKFRPWVLFGALPFGIVCVLAYSTPISV
ncbi:MFS transporter [Escherichia coli]